MSRTMNFRCLLLLLLLLGSSAQARETFVGQVSYVTDGDTLWVQPDSGGEPRKLRLLGVDAPEICQSGGKEARDMLAQLALQRRVTVKVSYYDRYGRGLATVALDGQDLGARMVRAGQAWSYGWRGRPGLYAAQETQARQSRSGVFAAASPESPRAFRKRHGSCHPDRK
ncbi:MAG: thermonuclease family protein [Comamonadaceae bacterium]|nr:thermonuclease family protein [Rhodoferax sp.]TSA07744.1 MAG: thermonuclease family protein [Comamonadaceae bacterium]